MKHETGKQKTGRPALYTDSAKLEAKIEDYFAHGVAKRVVVVGPVRNQRVVEIPVPTMSGLVLFLGFCSRQSFYDLEKRPAFSYAIKKARERICQVYEEQLHTGIPTGGIFALKNLGGWRDRDLETVNRPALPAPRFVFILNGQQREISAQDLANGRLGTFLQPEPPGNGANGEKTNGTTGNGSNGV